jgi:16S rRNA C1402 (ribose-2'-O) methylase RsmI
MVEDIRNSLHYNYRITAQKFRELSVNAERFGSGQILYESTERNEKTLEDLLAITRELKKDRRYALVDSYTEGNVLVKLESKAENILRETREKGQPLLELDPLFIRKAGQIFDVFEKAVGCSS